jgi:hypothetical protein
MSDQQSKVVMGAILGDSFFTYPVNGRTGVIEIEKPKAMTLSFFGPDCDVVLYEREDGYLVLEGEKIEEAAKLFFENVVQQHALELGRLRRQVKELENR